MKKWKYEHGKIAFLPLSALIAIIIVFTFFVTALTTTTFKLQLRFPSYISHTLNTSSDSIFLTMLETETPAFASENREPLSLSSLGLQATTNIKLNSAITLLGDSLPGFFSYHSEIITPGQGTNYTNTPVESSPSLDTILEKDQNNDSGTEEPAQPEEPQQPPNGGIKEKKVYIYHTHSWESYLPILGLTDDPDADKAVDNRTNITLVGKMLGNSLEKNNIGSIVDTTNMTQKLNTKGWGTVQAYRASREVVEAAKSQSDDLSYFIDLHRDSLRGDHTTIKIKEKDYAKVAFVIGKEQPNYEQNVKFAQDLHHALEKKYPGLSRGVIGKTGASGNGVYNQDISPRAILIEVGGVDNNMDELANTVSALTDVFSDYYFQAKKVDAPAN
ncbi:stage II sporulation protein P [Bacillus sp. JZ8]